MIMQYIFMLLTLILAHFITSCLKSGASWTKTKANWQTNHKATVVSFAVSVALSAMQVYYVGFSVPTILTIVGFAVVSELLLNRSN